MVLRLRIENATSLPDGGPLAVDVSGRRGIDIGRDQHLDWTLPDPTRFISGKHCEVRFNEGAYWLHDVSTNGTFLNGEEHRMRSPHRLRSGDRLEIGDYIVAVTVDLGDVAGREEPRSPAPSVVEDLWHVDEAVAPPLAPDPLRPRGEPAPRAPDFLDQLIDSTSPEADARWNDAAPPRTREPFFPPEFDWSGESARPAAPRGVSAAVSGAVARRSGPPRGAEAPASWMEDPPAPDAKPRGPRPESDPPAVAPVPSTGPTKPHPAADGAGDFRRMLARGAGVPESVFSAHSPAELAENMGRLLRLAAENVQHLLQSRSELKDIIRSSSHTMIMAADNNPLKFTPNVEDAIRMMFAPNSAAYLDAFGTFERSFRDLKAHQVQTYSAMQLAIGMLVKDLDPKQIEADTEPDRGFGAMVGSRKAKLWDIFVERWRAKVSRHEDGLLGAFLLYFSDCYDRSSRSRG